MSEADAVALDPVDARWLWPVRFPTSVGRAAWRFAGLSAPLYEGWRWLPAALAVGALPILCCYPLQSPAHQWLSGVALFALFVGALPRDHTVKGIATIALAYAAHSTLAVAFTLHDPVGMAACLPAGADYWQQQQDWITSGVDTEYRVSTWLPAHFQLLAAMVGASYLSLGLIPFWQGFFEVDLMNYYVGQLIGTSSSAVAAVGFGWHLWSLTRGVCYAVLVFEVASWSLGRLAQRPLSMLHWRKARWAVGLTFFALDCALKYVMAEPVRGRLAENLLGQ